MPDTTTDVRSEIVAVIAKPEGHWVRTQARMTWWAIDDNTLRLRADGDGWGPLVMDGPTVFDALLGIRGKLAPDVLMQVQAARRDAWSSTEAHPCGVDEIRLYPELGQPPTGEPVRALDPLPSENRDRFCGQWEHLLYRQEHLGQHAPGQLSWTDFDAQRRGVTR